MKLAIVLVSLLFAGNAWADGTILDNVDPDGVNIDGTSAGGRLSDFMQGASDASSQLSNAANAAQSANNLMQQLDDYFGALSALDQELAGRLQNDHGGPGVPSSCSGSAATPNCASCYAAAYGEVNFTRQTLERLRTITARTLNYIRAAEALGDTTSGIHGVTGLSWQYAKQGVEQEKRQFLATSTEKYNALIQNMHRALDMVAKCELDNFHNPDWYNRYGFMYFDFVKDAYVPHE